MGNSPDQHKIEDFLANRSMPPDADEVHAYLSTHPEALDAIRLMEDVDPYEIVERPCEEKIKGLNRVFARKRLFISTIRWLAAACIVGGLIIGAIIWRKVINERPVEGGTTAIVVNNPNTGMLHYFLPDSSVAVLDKDAAISFQSDYILHRTVYVTSGNVLFRVRKNSDSPFSVIANGISTTAIGTQFWVQKISNDVLTVKLTEGKVYIHSVDSSFRMDTVFLTPGQSCYINKPFGTVHIAEDRLNKERAYKKTNVNRQTFIEDQNTIVWTNDKMLLMGAKLKNVLINLEKRYHVKIVALDTSIYDASITGQIFYNDSLETLIRAICDLNKLVYERDKDTIYLKRN